MQFVANTLRNPFGLDPPCESFVPSYGVTDAAFHVVGDNPDVHGGRETGIPFTDAPWSADFFDALRRGGLVESVDLAGGDLGVERTFFSYLHPCNSADGGPDADDYARLEPYFDAELRAITADVLLPVGSRATAHVLETCTARPATDVDMDALHGTELRGSGWLVMPVLDPAEWTDGDSDRLVEGLETLQRRDFRREADLGRFLPDEQPYFVR